MRMFNPHRTNTEMKTRLHVFVKLRVWITSDKMAISSCSLNAPSYRLTVVEQSVFCVISNAQNVAREKRDFHYNAIKSIYKYLNKDSKRKKIRQLLKWTAVWWWHVCYQQLWLERGTEALSGNWVKIPAVESSNDRHAYKKKERKHCATAFSDKDFLLIQYKKTEIVYRKQKI